MNEFRSQLGGVVRDRAVLLTSALIGVFLWGLCALITANVARGYGAGQTTDVAMGYLYSYVGRSGYLLPFLIGVLVATQMFRHHTVARLVFYGSSRLRMYTNQAGSGLVVALIVAAVVVLGGVAAIAGVLTAIGEETALDDGTYWLMSLRTIAVFALWALIGFGLGMLVRNQVAAVVIVFVFAMLIEPTVTAICNESERMQRIGQYLPGGANWSAVWPVEAGSTNTSEMVQAGLSWQGGLGVLAAYAAVLLMAGYAVSLRKRDITA
ncbi:MULTISPECIES: hypothetical protein [Actinomyces]|uniref:ABC transporter permease n=1 Tax=Actinomyces respiraculi TaxID=2744574 RepID=A0A7T0LLI8_9ACTO|nr:MULTISPECIES: hypothetical protein [Actinomyces]QPL05563.1 hypothetical protein ID810_00770 [Actinomyces respiraculi]